MRQFLFLSFVSATLLSIACADSTSDGDACGSAANALSQCSSSQKTGTGSVSITFDSAKFATQCSSSESGLKAAECVNSHLGDCPQIMGCLLGGVVPKKDGGTDVDADEEVEDAGKKDGSISVTDGGKKDGSTFFDSSTPDSKPPPPPPPPVCQPGSAAGFTGGIYVPVAPGSKCTATQITAFQNCLLDPTANAAECDKVQGVNGDDPCILCIYTPDTATAYGAFIENASGARYNVSGCVEKVAGSTTAGKACAKSFEDLSACVRYVCDANCTTATTAELQTCYTTAGAGACATYDNAYATCETTYPKIATTCYKQGTESEIAREVRFAKTFCGK